MAMPTSIRLKSGWSMKSIAAIHVTERGLSVLVAIFEDVEHLAHPVVGP